MIYEEIFKSSSSGFYFATQLFPSEIREDVTKFYSFVRIADDYMDRSPKQPKKLQSLYQSWKKADPDLLKDESAKQILSHMLDLQKKYSLRPEWLEAFFDAMFMDRQNTSFEKLEDSLKYVHGSGEVIGLIMAKMMGCNEQAFKYAQMQGRAFQWINFIRDIEEDNQLGRLYFPKADLNRFGLHDLSLQTAQANPAAFARFIEFQLARYNQWQKQAKSGFKFISPAYLVAIEAAAKRYQKVANQITKNPLSVFKTKTLQPRQPSRA